MFLSFILLLLCIIARHQRSNRRLCEKRNLTDLVKLIAAIAVVVCHLFTFYMHNPAWAAESQFGSLSVSIFFFLSGYGLMCSYSLKGKKYLEGFCIHRISKIIIPLLTAYIISNIKINKPYRRGNRSNSKIIFLQSAPTL